MKDVIHWGVIGCGDVVETKNGPALYLAEGSELSGIWNRTTEKAIEWCKRHGHGRAYENLEELLNDPEIDIIYVATTPDTHKAFAQMVARAHKHCYIEKPIALSWEEAVSIREAFSEAGTRCFVAHYRRGMPRYRKLKELLDDNAIGKVRGIQVIRTQRQTAEELLPKDRKPWRVRPEISGGSHFYEGDAHMLDLIDYLAGPIIDFDLEVTNETHHYVGEDAVSLSGITENRVIVSGCWCYATYKAIDRFLIFGDEGSVEFAYYDNAAPLHFEALADRTAIAHEGVFGGVRKEAELKTWEVSPEVQSYPGLGQVQDIVDELRGVSGAQCLSTLESAMRTLRITCAAREKMKQSQQN